MGRRYRVALWVAVLVGALLIPTAVSAASCDVSVTSADELQNSITNPACEGRVIRIATGTYVPDLESDAGVPRSRTFEITVDNLTLQGVGADKTLLSGDLGAVGNIADNSYHVVLVDPAQVTKVTLVNLAIVDGNADDSQFTSDCSSHRIGGGIKLCGPQEGTVLRLDRVTIAGNRAFTGGGIFIGPETEAPSVATTPPRVVIQNSRFEDNLAGTEPADDAVDGIGQGGGVFSLFADIEVSRTTFKNNRAGFDGGGMDIIEGSADVQRSTFVDNIAQSGAAGFRVLIWEPAVQKGSNISRNLFDGNRIVGTDTRGIIFQRGAAVLMEGHANPDVITIIDRNTFRNNSSVGVTGALDLVNLNADVTRNWFDRNTARGGDGGALGIITTPLEFRGGIYAPRVTVDDNTFVDNTASGRGGALGIGETFVPPSPLQSEFVVTNNRFRRNQASESGGAIASDAQRVYTAKNVFIGNRAEGVSSITGEPTGNGGAIVATSALRNTGTFQFLAPIISQGDLTDLISTIIVEDSRFVGNYALKNGGAVSDDQAVTEPNFAPGILGFGEQSSVTGPGLARISISGSTFTGNTAEQGVGGAIAITGEGQRESYLLGPFTQFPWLPDETSAIIPSRLNLDGNRIVNNTAGTEGGGVFINDTSELNSFTDNTIRRNEPNDCSGCS